MTIVDSAAEATKEHNQIAHQGLKAYYTDGSCIGGRVGAAAGRATTFAGRDALNLRGSDPTWILNDLATAKKAALLMIQSGLLNQFSEVKIADSRID